MGWRTTRPHSRTDCSPLSPAESELSLASIAPTGWQDLQRQLAPDEMFIGLLACGHNRYLRTQLTASRARFDPVEVPDLLFPLHRRRLGEKLDHHQREALHRRAFELLAPPSTNDHRLVVCPDLDLIAVPWHLLDADGRPLGDRVAMSVVPAAGVLAELRRSGRPLADVPYVGVAEVDGGDREIENIRDTYFPGTGRCLPTGRGLELLDQRGHVGLLHITSHAYAPGFQFSGDRVVTPIDLADMALTADILLLTGCYLGAFGHDDSNEFFGIVRQLLVATGARAAVVSIAPVLGDAALIFSDLVVSALTGRAPNRSWSPPAEPLDVGDAVRWARLRMRELDVESARRLLGSGPDRWPGPHREAWWSPWFVLGDLSCRLPRSE